MGLALSLVELHKHEGKKYLPRRRLIPFPESKKRAPGQVNIIFKTLPSGIRFLDELPEGLYWWPDVQFVPQVDNQLVVSVGAFRARPGLTPVVACPRIHGQLYCSTILENKLSCYLYKGTKTSATPNVSTHPNGVDVSYTGCGKIHLLDMKTQYELTKDKDVRNNNWRHSDCSPNGVYVAVVAKCSRAVELHVLIIENTMFLTQGWTELHRICPGFVAERTRADYFECRFSPDSRYVAVGSSNGHLLVTARAQLKTYCNIIPGVLDVNDVRLATERAFDFDPRYFHRYVAFGSVNNEVFICDTEEERICARTKFEELDGAINAVRYGPKTRGLAVATSGALIYICDPDTLDVLYELNATEQASASMKPTAAGGYPAVVRLSFSTAGDQLAVSSTDGYCRVWQLQHVLNLQEMCRVVIMQHCSMKNMERLPLPPKLVLFLLNWSQ